MAAAWGRLGRLMMTAKLSVLPKLSGRTEGKGRGHLVSPRAWPLRGGGFYTFYHYTPSSSGMCPS
uniref:Uncharacterized protein n=1 Tax=Oryza meridionalis TaxID=40149 RepID=A0A0E0F0G3_9ORYZ